MNTVSKLHELEPSFSSARLLYQLCSSKDQNEEAVAYLQQAIDSEESVEADDAAMLLEMATFQFKKMNQYGKAVQTAKEAIEKDASVAAKANLLIGTIWYQVKCGGNEIEQRAKFWVATDYLQKAKNVDPALAADADELLRTCRTYFPTTEDAFMYDLQDGQSFTISCGGMSATTTVRTNK
jgi:tetratricopeptide (TPR) repeat protein